MSVSVLIGFIVNHKQKALSGQITMVVAQSKNGENFFNRNIMELFATQNDVDAQVIASPEKKYLEYIKSGLGSNRKEDVYYTAFSSQIYSFSMGHDITFFSGELSKEVPSVFYTLSKDNDSFFYVPVTWSPWGIYYNKSVFENLKVDEPESIRELELVAKKLLDNNIVPYSMMQKLKWPLTSWFDYINIRTNGAVFHNNLLAGRISFKDERVIKVYQEIYNMIESDYFFYSDEYDWTDMLEQLESGKTAMILGGAFFYENTSSEQKENLGWFPFPVNSNESSYDEIVTTSGYIVNGNIDGKDKRAIKEFVKFSHSDNAQKLIVANTDFYPLNKSALQSLNRDDLNKAYDHISKARRIVPSFERNNKPALHVYLKLSISMLFDIEDSEQIADIIDKIESERLKL